MSEPNFVPTTLDMTRVMDRLNGVPCDPSLLLPATYTHVAIAGTGTYGDVHFCLQNSALLSARSGLTASTDRSAVYEKLIKQLVAIKICCEPDSIKTLQRSGPTRRPKMARLVVSCLHFSAMVSASMAAHPTSSHLHFPSCVPSSPSSQAFSSFPKSLHG
jgi:hypothetical protein